MQRVFIAGATGYMGSRLAEELICRRHNVSGLVRPGSENRLPTGCLPVYGNALDRATRILTCNSSASRTPVPPKHSNSAKSI